MAAISPTQVSGKHNAIYEAYYKQVDSKGVGAIEAQDAAKFLKKSGLSDVVLSRIWDLSDPKGRGCLDKSGLFIALKLVSLAQAGHDINMRNILMELPNPPKVGEIPKIIQQSIQSVPVQNTDWSVKQSDRQKYESLFESLQPENGFIAGNKVKGVLMDSKLPLDTLGKIWDLADQDKDGSLDKHEFIVAMHLVYQALEKRAIPSSLPQELQKPKPLIAMSNTDMFGNGSFVANFPKDIAPPPVPPLPSSMINSSQPKKHLHSTESNVPMMSSDIIDSENTLLPLAAPVDWVVPKDDQLRFGEMFRESDKDKDGLVSGFEVKSVFLQSGVPQNCLAHIWALCDTKECGKLTFEQFALAMWMVERKKKGIEPPESLTPNMMPPSLRTGASETANQEVKPTYTNPELEMISNEIEELAHERRILETDIAQKEADIRIKSGEVRSLQSELDTLTATLKQLENQKGEAQKRLDDLKAQVQKIREQCQKQEATINEQETELNSKRSELQKLKDEETALEREYDANRKELDMLAKQSQDTQLQISQIKAMVTQLLETQRQMNDALLLCKAAIEANDAVLVSDYSLKIEPDFQEAKEMLEKRIETKIKSETFNSDPFNNVNGFGSDPFVSTDQSKTIGFNDSFSNSSVGGFDDAFTGGFASDQSKNLFPSATADPFGDKTNVSTSSVPGKDEFGTDPFAILHAPTSTGQVLSGNHKSGPPPRPESPSPALPPKKSKQPPPRPAPPRPLQGPTRPAPPTTDAFESSKGFADFADFDTKQSLPLPSSTTKASVISDQPQEQILNTRSMQPFETLDTFNKTTTSAAIDFIEDPFKDYRYEDVFNIADPFSEQDDGDLSADDVSPKIPEAPKNNNFKLDDNYNATKVLSENNNFLPTITPLETNFANFDEFGAGERTTTKLEAFDAFCDDSQKFSEQNVAKLNNQITNEIFSAKTKVPLTKPNTLNSTITSDMNLYNILDDKFEESFSKSTSLNKDNQKVNESTTKSHGKFNAFVDNFETDFSNTKSFNNNINDSNNNKQNTVRLDMRNASSLSKPSDLKMSQKFLDDYSSGDKFGSDLETVLQRSLTDQ